MQNSVLVLERQRREVKEQVGELQHLMRDLRQRDLVIDSSVYCQAGPTYVKKKPQELYPTLELSAGRLKKTLAKLRAELSQ